MPGVPMQLAIIRAERLIDQVYVSEHDIEKLSVMIQVLMRKRCLYEVTSVVPAPMLARQSSREDLSGRRTTHAYP